MFKYRKKPVEIEAFQFSYNKCMPIITWFADAQKEGIVFFDGMNGNWYIKTLEGNMSISEGDYIIKGVKGEIYPCKEDIFLATYARVDDSEDLCSRFNFSEAIKLLKQGFKLRRKGWNGKGIFIELQKPDENSKMTQPYVYIVTSFLQSDNTWAPKGVVPWAPSQTDLLAEDWEVAI